MIWMSSDSMNSRSFVSGPWQTFLPSSHNPRRGLRNSGRFCWPCLSPSDLLHTGQGLGLESHRALSGTSDPREPWRAAVGRQPRPAVNTALAHFGGKKNSRKMTPEKQQSWSVFGLARQYLKHVDHKITGNMMPIIIIRANIHQGLILVRYCADN